MELSLKKLGRLHYIVRHDDGFVFKRHLNLIRATNVQAPTPTTTHPNVVDSYNYPIIDPQILQCQAVVPLVPAQGLCDESAVPSISTTAELPQEEVLPSTSQNAETESTPSRRTSVRQRKAPSYLSNYMRH